MIQGDGVPLVKSWLEGLKERSFHCITGSVCLRKTVGTLKVKDQAKAVEIAKDICPESVVESVSVTAIKKKLFDVFMTKYDDEAELRLKASEAFEFELPDEKATIKV